MLTVDTAIPYLLERGLISAESVLYGGATATTLSRRNSNLRLRRTDGPGYLLKQLTASAVETVDTVGQEVAFYAYCHQRADLKSLRQFMPSVAYVDQRERILILEYIEGATTLWNHYRAFPYQRFPTQTCESLGLALGTLHRVLSRKDVCEDAHLHWILRSLPWILNAHRPSPDLLSVISRADYEIINIIQNDPALASKIDDASSLWHPMGLIHDDVKSDNILVAQGPDGAHTVRLVDWELVQWGDPGWDLAGILQDYVLFWLMSMSPASSIEGMVETATYPLPVLQSGIRALWRGYRQAWPALDGLDLLRRSVMFSGVRMIQSAYEMAQRAHELPPTSVLLLQVAANILAEPEVAQVEVYGMVDTL